MNDDVFAETKAEVDDLLSSIYCRPDDMTDRTASKQVMAYVESKFAQSSLYAVDYLLEVIDFDRVPVHVTSAVLRTTSSAHRVLPAWSEALERARNNLNQQSLDVASLLQGLPD